MKVIIQVENEMHFNILKKLAEENKFNRDGMFDFKKIQDWCKRNRQKKFCISFIEDNNDEDMRYIELGSKKWFNTYYHNKVYDFNKGLIELHETFSLLNLSTQ